MTKPPSVGSQSSRTQYNSQQKYSKSQQTGRHLKTLSMTQQSQIKLKTSQGFYIHNKEQSQNSSMYEDMHQELQNKNQIIYKLNQQLNSQSQILTQKKGEVQDIFDVIVDKTQNEQVEYLKLVLVELVKKEQACLQILTTRAHQLQGILGMFDGQNTFNFDNQRDYVRFREQVDILAQSLQSAAKTEVDYGAKVRECEKLNIQVSVQKHKCKTISDKNNELQKIIDLLQSQNKILTEENNKLQRLLNIEKKTAENNQRKVNALEKRIEFILENDINTQLNPSDKLRNSLNELLRENESLKRDLTHKNQEIERQYGTINRLNSFVTRLNKKIDQFKKQPGQGGNQDNLSSQIGKATDETQKFYKKDDIDLLSNYVIPDNLDYRVISMKSEYMNVLSDVVEIGPLGFSNHVLKNKDESEKQEMVCLIANQFLSYKELAEKLNYIVRDIKELYNCTTMKEVTLSINSKFGAIFNAKRVNLWIADATTGLLSTFNEISQKKCIMNKGIIGEVFYYKQALNIKNAKAKPILHMISQDTYKEEPDYVDTTLLLPIFVQKGRIKAVIEISNSQSELFSFDEEYLGIVLSQYLGMYLIHHIEKQVVQTELKYKNLMFNAFEDLSQAQTKYQFQQRVIDWIFSLFGVNLSIFYFIEDDKLTIYDKHNNKTQYGMDYGLVGTVAQQLKGYILNDIKYSSVYNKLVDIKTIMPVYAVPLIEQKGLQKKCIGVMELSLKNQFKSKFERDQLIDPEEGLLGVEEPLANVIQNFSKLIQLSLKQNNFKDKLETENYDMDSSDQY